MMLLGPDSSGFSTIFYAALLNQWLQERPRFLPSQLHSNHRKEKESTCPCPLRA